MANLGDVSNVCRGRIIGLWEGGMSANDIAHRIGCSKVSVQTLIKRFQEEGIEGLKDKKKMSKQKRNGGYDSSESSTSSGYRRQPYDRNSESDRSSVRGIVKVEPESMETAMTMTLRAKLKVSRSSSHSHSNKEFIAEEPVRMVACPPV
ncbi:uncharacterized protein LOC143899075 [Temnothorax americanus]|uniref:uncharacterized protein LOC143899075 n=1 Tax=Temnothorax americanus TaxID=1964332 RepID=UPI004068E2E9